MEFGSFCRDRYTLVKENKYTHWPKFCLSSTLPKFQKPAPNRAVDTAVPNLTFPEGLVPAALLICDNREILPG